MLELFKIGARLALDKGDFDRGVSDADQSGKSLAESLEKSIDKVKNFLKNSAIVALAVKGAQAVWNLAKSTSEAGDRIDKQSQALGFSRKAYQEWEYILRQSGASIDDMGMAMKTMQEVIAGNSAEAAAGLSKLGLSAAHLQSLSPEDQFETLVKAFQQMPEGAEKSRLAIQLFGRNAQSLMPLLNSSADELDGLRQRAHDLGLIMSDEDVDASVAFGDALDDLNAVWGALKQKFGAQLLPGFTKGLVAAANALGRITNAVSDAFKTGDWKKVFNAITEEISNFVPGIIDTVVNIATGLFENADKIIDLAISIVNGLADGLAKALPKLVAKLPQIARSLLNGFKNLGKTIGNSVIDIINGVFGTNIPHIDEIRWPTWPEVQKAATDAWNKIKEEAQKLAGLVFGTKADGSVDWPDWPTVQKKANEAWEAIKEKALTLAGLVFGKKEDGSVDWPTWPDVVKAANDAWDGIKAGALDLAGLVFGRKEDGSVDWPTWPDVVKAANDAWDAIKEEAAKLGGLVFGKNSDGSVKWPSWHELLESFDKWWNGENGIRAQIEKCAIWVLNIFGLPKETVSSISKLIGGWWEPLRAAAEGALSWFLADPETPDANQAGVRLRKAVEEWWGRIKDTVGSVLKLILGIPENPSEVKAAESIRKWWDNNVVPILRNALDFVLGLFGLPPFKDMVKKIRTWWEDVKKEIADFLTIKLGIDFSWGGNGPDTSGYDNPQNQEGFESEGTQYAYDEWGNPIPLFAKGLNYVPYDGYRAVLHRGETVLNQNQGREWRQSGGSGLDMRQLYESVASAVAAAVSGIAINMDGKAVGNAVTEQVSRNLYLNQLGRRFATP